MKREVLPFKVFEKLIKGLIDQRCAEREIMSGIAKYNSTYEPVLEMPLTTQLVEIIEELYEDKSEYPLLSWWLFDAGEIDEETLVNKNAIIYYKTPEGKEREQLIETLYDLWSLMENDYWERKEDEKKD